MDPHDRTPPTAARGPRGTAARVAILLGLALSIPATGCGYRAGPMVPPGVRTVAVPVFENDTFRREIEVELTRAVAEEFHARTPLEVVGDPDSADLVLRGRIRDFKERVLADRSRNRITESSVVVTVDVVFENRVSGTTRTRSFFVTEPYSTTKGQSLDSARAEAFENLAEKITQALEGDWPDDSAGESS